MDVRRPRRGRPAKARPPAPPPFPPSLRQIAAPSVDPPPERGSEYWRRVSLDAGAGAGHPRSRSPAAARARGRRGGADAGLWTAPNVLTLLRLAAVPPFLWLGLLGLSLTWQDAVDRWGAGPVGLWGICGATPRGVFESAPSVAAWIFVVAALTDWLDGQLARRLQLVSRFGAFLDPVADKAGV